MIILGTSDAWSTICLSYWPSNLAVLYYRLTNFIGTSQSVLSRYEQDNKFWVFAQHVHTVFSNYFVLLNKNQNISLIVNCRVPLLSGHAYWNPSIYDIMRWVVWTMGQTNNQPSAASDVLCIIFFHDFLQNSLQNSFQSIVLFFFIRLQK